MNDFFLFSLRTIPEETKIVKKRAVLSPQKVSSIMVSETSAIRYYEHDC